MQLILVKRNIPHVRQSAYSADEAPYDIVLFKNEISLERNKIKRSQANPIECDKAAARYQKKKR